MKIVSTGLNYLGVGGKTVIVVVDDTDIAVMLLYLWREEMEDLILL